MTEKSVEGYKVGVKEKRGQNLGLKISLFIAPLLPNVRVERVVGLEGPLRAVVAVVAANVGVVEEVVLADGGSRGIEEEG